MPRKKKTEKDENLKYSKNASFENLKEVQKLALTRKGKDDEVNPDISIFLKAEELKGKLCGLYSAEDKQIAKFNIMGTVKIDGKNLIINVGEDADLNDN